MASPSIVWLRQDLRLADQAALAAAAAAGPVVPVYVLDDEAPGAWRMGEAQRWWLHRSLARLDEALRARGSRLVLRRGDSAAVLARLAAETGAVRIHATAHVEPWWAEAERAAERALAGRTELIVHAGAHLAPPGVVRTAGGKPYRIFTPFWRALCERMPPAAPMPAPHRLVPPEIWPESDRLESWALLPRDAARADGFARRWCPGEQGAIDAGLAFAETADDYAHARDLPSRPSTSRLSPHLHFGEVSPATLWRAIADPKFRSELGWRDFAHAAAAATPDLGRRNGRRSFDDFPWRTGRAADRDFDAWTRGRTGYPIVDAGMRELRETGWMHNRVRMLAASFLVKHLSIDWRRGAGWFWENLLDADYAANSLNWQWVAGTGIDSAPFPRIMAPLVQSRKFGAADYIRRWVPELADCRDDEIHEPSGVPGYPAPLVGHREGRERALAAFAAMREARTAPG